MTAALEFEKVDILFTGWQAASASGDQGGACVARPGPQPRRNPGRDRRRRRRGGCEPERRAGRNLVLMGLSGSGKSTLLRAANGLNPRDAGRVLVTDGEQPVDVAPLRRGDAAPAAARPHRDDLPAVRPAAVAHRSRERRPRLELRGEPAAERRRIVDEKLELVGLSQWAELYGHELSGGMQQRVGLARAFATDAEILLMDEPFSALDPLIRSKLQDELRSLQKRVRKSILFVTHDLDEALRLGDRISILEGGRIMQSGTPADIMLRPANSHVAEFVRHVNPLSVLNGSVVMRRWRDLELYDGRRWLDAARQYELLSDEQGRPVGRGSTAGR
jgi:glycine betaine/proline transport system ATP-binding protein